MLPMTEIIFFLLLNLNSSVLKKKQVEKKNYKMTLSFYHFYWILALKELFKREYKDVFLTLQHCRLFSTVFFQFFFLLLYGLVSTSSLFRSIFFEYMVEKSLSSLCVWMFFSPLEIAILCTHFFSFDLTTLYSKVSIEGSSYSGHWLLSISCCNYNLIETTAAATAM